MESSSLRDYLLILRKWLWLILLIFAGTMAFILVRAWQTPPAYRSTVSVQIIPLEASEVPLFARLNNYSPFDNIDLVLTQFSAAVRSPITAQHTISDTGVAMTAGDLIAKLAVEREAVGDRLSVSLTGANPQDAEALLSRHVALALKEYAASRVLQTDAVLAFLEKQLVLDEQELTAAQADVRRFKLDNNVEDPSRELQIEQDTVRTLRDQQEEAEAEATRLDAVANALQKQSDAALAKGKTFAATNAEGAYWRGLAQELNTQAINRGVDAAGQRARQSAVATRLAQHQTNLSSLITLVEQFDRLETTLKEKQGTYDFIAAKVQEAALKKQQVEEIGYLQVVGRPSTPKNQLPTRTTQIAVLGGAISILAGVVLAFALEMLERSLRRSPADKVSRS